MGRFWELTDEALFSSEHFELVGLQYDRFLHEQQNFVSTYFQAFHYEQSEIPGSYIVHKFGLVRRHLLLCGHCFWIQCMQADTLFLLWKGVILTLLTARGSNGILHFSIPWYRSSAMLVTFTDLLKPKCSVR